MTFSRVAVLSDGVHRSTGEWTPSVHAVLRALEGSGIAGIPRVLGFDEQRREMLSFVDGVVPDFPTPPCLWTDAAVTSSASLLRELHDASAPLVVALTGDEVRRSPIHEPVEVICHNDFAPYNLAYRDGICVGAIDFDTVSPGPRLWDLAYFAYRIVPLTAPGTEDDVDLSTSEREHRLRLLIMAYGTDATTDSLQAVAVERHLELAAFSERRAADEAEPDFARHAEQYRADAAHLAAAE